MAVPKKKTSKAKSRSRRASAWKLETPARSVCPRCGATKLPARGLRELRLVRRPSGHRRRVAARRLEVDDACRSPWTRWVGTRRRRRSSRARTEPSRSSACPCRWSGQPEVLAPLAGDLEVIPASEVIAMSADPGSSVRKMKDSSLVRAAEAVRDGKASAMISAGNTGATMASALLRMGRIKGVSRPAIATPIPVPGHGPTILLDAGANAECQPDWLVQFAQMGVVFARTRYGIERAARRAPVHRRGAVQGHAAREGDPRAARRLRGAASRRRHLRRQRRGPRRDDARRRRGRHRRLHRQRRAQDARGRHAHAGRARSSGPSAPTTRPRRPARC